MNEPFVRNVIEAALLAAGKSLQPAELAQLFDDSGRPAMEEIRAALATLANEYADRGIEIKETAAGFRIQVRRELANEISRLWPERPAKYSRALLETLALIAYRQPITRAEIEAVRGVAVNPNIIKTLLERNWIRVVGHRDVPGRPELLGTTREFLEYFGLRSLDELPPLAQLKTLGELNMQLELPGAPIAGDAVAAAEGALLAESVLTIAENGPAEGGTRRDGDATSDIEATSDSGAPHESSGDAEAEAATDSGSSDADEMSEDDELSADGSGSRELVAAPPNSDD